MLVCVMLLSRAGSSRLWEGQLAKEAQSAKRAADRPPPPPPLPPPPSVTPPSSFSRSVVTILRFLRVSTIPQPPDSKFTFELVPPWRELSSELV